MGNSPYYMDIQIQIHTGIFLIRALIKKNKCVLLQMDEAEFSPPLNK